eukprot:Phypoly_transcript_21580.p1 GENE.Phypoly_transcript_21580~~Phypoly_transcript_21580.p1  ORF type:complete len:126 (+),score=19.14 Phypoly_transcript_21580:98-475(+)
MSMSASTSNNDADHIPAVAHGFLTICKLVGASGKKQSAVIIFDAVEKHAINILSQLWPLASQKSVAARTFKHTGENARQFLKGKIHDSASLYKFLHQLKPTDIHEISGFIIMEPSEEEDDFIESM